MIAGVLNTARFFFSLAWSSLKSQLQKSFLAEPKRKTLQIFTACYKAVWNVRKMTRASERMTAGVYIFFS